MKYAVSFIWFIGSAVSVYNVSNRYMLIDRVCDGGGSVRAKLCHALNNN